jgi:hypothetical protein
MYDAKKVSLGILIFLVLLTFPFWYGKGRAVPSLQLKIDTPEIARLAEKKCLEPTAYMRASHMELIDSWRQAVVRDGQRYYVTSSGKNVSMSLSQSCLGCHSNKEQFCDTCHNYAAVNPNCWSCHNVPKEAKR